MAAARPRVLLTSCAARPAVPLALMRRVARGTLRAVRAPSGCFSVAFVDGPAMRRLNRRHLGHDCVTDVLSFDLRRRGTRRGPVELLGEVIIAPSVARRQARRFGQTYAHELARYVVHGVLHWAGYDDHAPAARRRMVARQERLLAQLLKGTRS